VKVRAGASAVTLSSAALVVVVIQRACERGDSLGRLHWLEVRD
jgi:hypothetical protein